MKAKTVKPRKITIHDLVQHFACDGARRDFRRLFGRSVVVTEALAARYCRKFDIMWCADHLLRDGTFYEQRTRLPEVIALDKAQVKANERQRKLLNTAMARHDGGRMSDTKYEKRVDALWDAYTASLEKPRLAARRATARLFARLYNEGAR